jgi:ankyrin repeat protein
LPVPKEYSGSKRALRQYYHEKLAPASDVDLFIYGLNEEEAIEKIKQIETRIRDSILQETTTVRTKHAITIVSQYPTRHIQIVLRLYKSVSEILTGFDVDCSCVAYNGEQVYAAPRAIGALMTQINHVDLSRRSPSYEARLSKYSHRGFEIYWPQLDRSKIDPTIFERSFTRTLGLARLLVLEQLPKEKDRTDYLNKRRQERGRPQKREDLGRRLWGNIKDGHEDEIAEWVQEDDAIANYHTFTIPYGEKFNAKRIEKLLYTKDLLLNAEWNTKQREVKLHRHPAFFGDAENIVGDCCGFCPEPTTEEEEKVAEEEGKIYVSGNISFLTDDPGRQTIGSFNPITDTDWTEMAYIGNTARLCEAIVDCDLEAVQDCLKEGIDPNRRDYTGRTPLHLAVMSSSPEVVQCLLDNGAYLVLRLADGRNAIHLAATRGDLQIITLLHRRNQHNIALAEEAAKDEPLKAKIPDKETNDFNEESNEESDGEFVDDSDMDMDSASVSEASADLGASTFIKVESCKNILPGSGESGDKTESGKLEPKDDIIDANLAAWDSGCTPHHLAIAMGHHSGLEYLISSFGSNPNCPVKLANTHSPSAILGLVLALTLSGETFEKTANVLMEAGAKCSQADLKGFTAFHYYANHGAEMINYLLKNQKVIARSVMNWIVVHGSTYSPQYINPLRTTIENGDFAAFQRLVELGAKLVVEFEPWMQGLKFAFKRQIRADPEKNLELFKKNVEQPIILAVQHEQVAMVRVLLDKGADINTLTVEGQSVLLDTYSRGWRVGATLLDRVRHKISELEAYDVENESGSRYVVVPLPLKDDEHYLQGISEGTYEHSATSELLKDAKKSVKEMTERMEKRLEIPENLKGVAGKKAAIAKLITTFQELERDLLSLGAKSFTEIHPDIGTIVARVTNNVPRHTPEPVETKVTYSFRVADLTDTKREAYVRLFEAAWTGDVDTVKSLTTVALGPSKNQPPLNISTSDTLSNTPFSIAILRGHLDLAETILDIIQAQYVPGKPEMSYTMNGGSDDSDSEDDVDDDERIQLYERLPASVRNQFTIDDIGEISTLVKSDVSPLKALHQIHRIHQFCKDEPNEAEPFLKRNAFYPPTLLGYAIHTDNLELLTALLDAGDKYQHIGDEDEEDANRTANTLSPAEFKYAIALGRVKLLSEVIKRTGSGLPLDDLVQKSGVEIKETPKYYTGLSIRGTKRKDWAEAYQNKQTVTKYDHHPPLLEAARAGNIEAIEWFMSDAPLRLYSEFSEANKDDERLKSLNQAAGGFDKMVMNWLDTRSKFKLYNLGFMENANK